MTTGIVALCCVAVSLVFGAGARSALRTRRFLSALVRALSGLVFLLLAALLGTITVGLHGYQELTFEEVAATVKTEPLGPQRFRATITLPDKRLAMYELAGDAFYIDAHILKWRPLANVLGLHTAYELDRLAGRYQSIEQERSAVRTVHSLSRDKLLDLFALRQRYAFLGTLLDTEYGSATFLSSIPAP